ncbi:MAG: metallophosphoesterase [Nitrospinaceae bacterium]|nr:metallophosphoesterase family protein [Nitrospinaceae bacterium]NIR54157.1 metallophosphoesterase family protein [Nitrospinaceae bacterium]NIS84571.1 metallophosphoesterase family protein [Nitrospinaceae bacterium]NIT81363.1 metallophosphoesterase family protein [Nitrospinaceae bacterium]NIU43650.1 metallophosphoesterase family protein [Nitrospinaceae bacterium]
MVYLIFSDLHSNLESLEKFIEIGETLPHDQKVCLGDIVGYNTNPNECVDWVRENVDIVLAGNHDYAVVGKTDASYFNPYAMAACVWTRDILTEENIEYLSSLPVRKEQNGIQWVHSSPFEPDQWHYVNNKYDGEENFPHFDAPCCFLGHSHKPVILEREPGCHVEAIYGGAVDYWQYDFKPDHRYIVNVGSLGQPRDGMPLACYVVYDSERQTVEFKRFEYNLKRTQEKILSHNLPSFLAERLEAGF